MFVTLVGFLTLLGLVSPTASTSLSTTMIVEHSWRNCPTCGGGFNGRLNFYNGPDGLDGWMFHLELSNPVSSIAVYNVRGLTLSLDGKTVTGRDAGWNSVIQPWSTFLLTFTAYYSGSTQPTGYAILSSIPTVPVSITTQCTISNQWYGGFITNCPFIVNSEIKDWTLKVNFVPCVNNLIDIWYGVSSPALSSDGCSVTAHSDGSKMTVGSRDFGLHLQRDGNTQITVTATVSGKTEDTGATSTTRPTTTTPPPTKTTPPTTTTPTTTTTTPSTTTTTSSTTTTTPTTTATPTTTTKPPTTTSTTTTRTSSTFSPQSTPSGGGYDYTEVLRKSILFYEAQRSGRLPASNRIPWRGDSALGDGSDVQLDLTGGWYDAGDHVKFGFPMAASATVLAWGILQFKSAYRTAGELSNALDSLKWVTDYFLKCHTGPHELYVQVGSGEIDHAYWVRAEDMTMRRPSHKVDASHPGSDVAGETAAALAASALVFKENGDAEYAEILRTHAEQIFNFADTYKGKYSDHLSDAAKFYNSYSGYKDELMWAAVWLYKLTGNRTYLNKAETIYNDGLKHAGSLSFSWDEKTAPAFVLLYEATGNPVYKTSVETYLNQFFTTSDKYTPGGLLWLSQWGSLRYTANVAFCSLVAAEHGILPVAGREFAKNQIHYMLGDNPQGRSYVVGFGHNPPVRPHHNGASCREDGYCFPTSSHEPNPHVLYGALVGGPDKSDDYKDLRSDYVKNEVACDYNAGFQGAIAGLISLNL